MSEVIARIDACLDTLLASGLDGQVEHHFIKANHAVGRANFLWDLGSFVEPRDTLTFFYGQIDIGLHSAIDI